MRTMLHPADCRRRDTGTEERERKGSEQVIRTDCCTSVVKINKGGIEKEEILPEHAGPTNSYEIPGLPSWF